MRTSGLLLTGVALALGGKQACAFVPSRAPGSFATGNTVAPNVGTDLPVVDAARLTTVPQTMGSALSVKGGGKQVAAEPASDGWLRKVQLGVYFFLWYALNIGYNISNKKTLNAISFPWTLSVVQLIVGSIFVLPLWATGLRKAPGLNKANIKTLLPIAFCHMMSHVSAVIGLGAGAVSFVHIVKAAEPLFTALFRWLH